MGGSLDEFLNLVEGLWNCYDIAGNASVLRRHADQWRRMEAELHALADDLQASVAARLAGGRDGNWNDQAGENFQQVWRQTRQAIHDLAGQFGGVAKNLDQFAGEVDNFNDNFHSLLITIGVCTTVMVATSWIPGVDLVTDGGGALVDAGEVDEAWNLIDLLRATLIAVRNGLSDDGWLLARGFLRNFLAKALAPQFLLNYSLPWLRRFIERGLLLGDTSHGIWTEIIEGRFGDPTKGWSTYDNVQLLVPVSTLISISVPEWAAAGDGIWTKFWKNSLLRIGQTELSANVFNVLNQAVIEGKGFNFDLGQVLGVGSASAALPLIVIIGSDAFSVIFRGKEGLPQEFTLPANTVVNTVLEVGLPSVRTVRGLIYTTVAGQLPATTSSLPDDLQSTIGAPPTYVVKPGDTLWDIATHEYGPNAGIEYWEIVKRNHIRNPDLIHPGDVLVLPPITPPGTGPDPAGPALGRLRPAAVPA
ncbi:MAG TPA: LysM peptidoglycan-binding domain-containing protein [Candidatus Dormibacteraeota bacterium]|nr:LysM peptidoglycan-binding domain-containing protein [Candidatus Dormibacteraeota bacterium]